jgi:uncharacterized membrane protein
VEGRDMPTVATLLVSGHTLGTIGYYNPIDYTLMPPKIGPILNYGVWAVQYLNDIVYVSDIANSKIWKFNYNTRSLIGSFNTIPLSYTTDAQGMIIYDGIIYLLQCSTGNVYKYDLDGNLLGSFNGGPAWVTYSIAIANGSIFVSWVETWANSGRISKYSLEGASQGTVNFVGHASGLFIDTEMIIANMYSTINKVQVYTLGGSLLRESGILARGGAMHTTLATNSLIYVCNSYHNWVWVFDRNTLNLLSYFGNEKSTVGMCFGKTIFYYPPADPIDDNPDTLPDPGGDPQEITFRWETYKAIRSDESLLK